MKGLVAATMLLTTTSAFASEFDQLARSTGATHVFNFAGPVIDTSKATPRRFRQNNSGKTFHDRLGPGGYFSQHNKSVVAKPGERILMVVPKLKGTRGRYVDQRSLSYRYGRNFVPGALKPAIRSYLNERLFKIVKQNIPVDATRTGVLVEVQAPAQTRGPNPVIGSSFAIVKADRRSPRRLHAAYNMWLRVDLSQTPAYRAQQQSHASWLNRLQR